MRRLLPVIALLAACGDPLIDAGYRGEPLYLVRGQVLAMLAPAPGEELLYRASVFWITGAAGSGRLIEQASVSTKVFLPDVFDVLFYRTPEAAHFQSKDPPYAVGVLIVYVDRNADGRYDAEADTVLAATTWNGFAYAPAGVDLDRSPAVGRALPAGFSLVELPPRCPRAPGQPESVPPPAPPRACGAQASCGADEACDPVHHLCVPRDPLGLDITSSVEIEALACRQEP